MGTSLALLLLFTLFANVELIQVKVAQGILDGETLPLVNSKETYESFKGIPYAAPPIGNKRFMAPEPPASWSGVRDAKSHRDSCPQVDIFTLEEFQRSEDCLFLNVYTPKIDPAKLLPVMVFIHGGGFKSGSGNSTSYGPEFLLKHDVILVTLNYRLEVLGFLCLDTEKVPGNAGLKDQVAALKWVQENIKQFGGDPENVTIFGQSAGGASVGYHLISPLSKGLFKRAIMMSGTPLCEFTISYKPVKRAFILAKQTGLDTSNTTEVLTHLQNLPINQLINTKCKLLTSEEIVGNIMKIYEFGPVIEKQFGENKGFLTNDVLKMIPNANAVDVMVGYTNYETSTIADLLVRTFLKIYDRYPEMLVPITFLFNLTPDENLESAEIIRKQYFGNADAITEKLIKEFVTFTSDSSFVYSIHRFLNSLPVMIKNSRHLYKFTMSSNRNTYGNSAIKFGLPGVAGHLDDTKYLFTDNLSDPASLSETESTLIDTFCTLLTNFAKYGNPTPTDDLGVKWLQYNTTNKNYLEIGNTLTTGTAPDDDMVTFWEGLYNKYKQPFGVQPKEEACDN